MLRALFDEAPVGQGYWDAELRYRTVNARLAEINGIPAAAHIGRTPSELLGELGVEVEAALRGVLETGRPAPEIDFAGETPAEPGVRRHWVVSFFPVHDGVGSVVVDVTVRQLAAELEHAALAAAETALARAEALARASAALGSSVRTDRLLKELVEAVVPALADLCTVHLSRRDGVEPVAVAVANPAQEEIARALADRQAADPRAAVGPAAVARTGVAEINASITAADLIREGVGDEERELLGRLGIRSAVILPLTARGTVLGALTLAMGNASGRVYQAELVELAEQRRGGRRARARQRAAVRRAGRGHLGAAAHAAARRAPLGSRACGSPRATAPSGRSNDVGGDFYDVFEAGDGEWALVIGDVVGKGARGGGDHRARARHAAGRGPARRRPARGARAGRRGAAPAPRDRLLLGGARPHARRGRRRRGPPAGRRAPAAAACCARGGELEEVGAKRHAARHLARARRSARSSSGSDPATPCCCTPTARPSCAATTPGAASRRCATRSARAPDPTPAALVERVEREALVLSGGELRDDLALLAVAAPPDEQ